MVLKMELYKLMWTSIFVILCCNQLLLWQRRRRRGYYGRRRWWVRPINRPRNEQSYETNILREMETQDHEEFFQNFRMWPEHFDWLLNQVQDKLQKRSRRAALDLKLCLQVILLYLAQGDFVISKHIEFRIGKSTAHAIIPETCRAIWDISNKLWKKEQLICHHIFHSLVHLICFLTFLLRMKHSHYQHNKAIS
ncbi:uncharacterized protein LOC116853409 [Odontomachus brunneus]|uniref:uncharacterized protein LOC116853409 n=1 Tax=Odontomachus brunneus TaxID=486640 RepID=UPI0013F1DC8C|nr:uncharacterized protein LOC116853409 [Odontomachus brunneus]